MRNGTTVQREHLCLQHLPVNYKLADSSTNNITSTSQEAQPKIVPGTQHARRSMSATFVLGSRST